MATVTEHPDHERVMAAYDALSDLLTDTTPRPWETFQNHGRDITDEGWSVIGVQQSGGSEEGIALTYMSGFEPPESEANARLIAEAVNGWVPALTLARYVADRHRPVWRQPFGSLDGRAIYRPTDEPRCVTCGTVAPCVEYAGAAAVVNVVLTIGADAVCCDLHGRNCEPPSELCCERCTEAAHPLHADGSICSNPDLSRSAETVDVRRP